MKFKKATMEDFDAAFDFIEKLWSYNTYDKDESPLKMCAERVTALPSWMKSKDRQRNGDARASSWIPACREQRPTLFTKNTDSTRDATDSISYSDVLLM